MKRFELGVYAFPGGTSYCNRAVTERGDYKELAFVDYMGKVKFYIDPSLIPGDVLLRIEHDSSATAENFKAKWNEYPASRKYQRLHDIVGTTASIHVLCKLKDFDMDEKVDFMEAVAFGWLAHSEKVAQAVQDFKDKLPKR